MNILQKLTLTAGLLTAFTVQANSKMLICQTKTIQPGMSIEEVKSLCDEPLNESDDKVSIICDYPDYDHSICNPIKFKYLTYKRSAYFKIEFQDGIVTNVDMQILQNSR